MTEHEITQPDQLIPVKIESFRNSTRDINFDVYLKLSDQNVAHVFSRTTGLDYKRLAQYIQKGVKYLYIHPDDKASYQEFIAKPALAIFNDPNTPQEKKIATLLNMTEQNMSEIFSQISVRDETAENAKTVVKGYIQLMAATPNTMAVILKLVSHGDYLYYHSIAVAIFSLVIARASGQFNQRTLELVGMGGFLHDIGTTQMPKALLEKPSELTPEEWEEMHGHPKAGLKMLEGTTTLPDEVRYIVYQHHEAPNSRGYPNGLRGPVIYYPAKVVALADAFSALISRRPYRDAYTVEQALGILRSHAGRYDRELLDMVTTIFKKSGTKAAA